VFTIVYVTLLFGIGMPILYPIAILNLSVIYLVERYVLAYYYRVPPTMDDRLVKNAMETLRFAPLVFLMNAFWMLTNQQIFANDVSKLETSLDRMNPNHDLGIILEFTPASPILLVLVFLLIANFFKQHFPAFLERNDYTISKFNKTVIESLPAYNNVVQASEADKLIKANRYFQQNFDFSVSTKAMKDSLINQRVSLSPMASIPWYNVLFNHQYI
jgi:hypothetical protein